MWSPYVLVLDKMGRHIPTPLDQLHTMNQTSVRSAFNLAPPGSFDRIGIFLFFRNLKKCDPHVYRRPMAQKHLEGTTVEKMFSLTGHLGSKV
jgi:hypothetical protein